MDQTAMAMAQQWSEARFRSGGFDMFSFGEAQGALKLKF